MRVLFVCWANVGRSQMAAAFYNLLTGTHDADSAGTEVEQEGETLAARKLRRGGTYTIEAMAEEGIDVAEKKKQQVTPAMLNNYEKIICMAQTEYTPEWLENSPNFVRWEVADPGGKGLEETRVARDAIKEKVAAFIAQSD